MYFSIIISLLCSCFSLLFFSLISSLRIFLFSQWRSTDHAVFIRSAAPKRGIALAWWSFVYRNLKGGFCSSLLLLFRILTQRVSLLRFPLCLSAFSLLSTRLVIFFSFSTKFYEKHAVRTNRTFWKYGKIGIIFL